jgi:type IV pilus assembly protein PilB
MTDVDAVRLLASEHNLEFVDLDHYTVDPAASALLPVTLARRHHVVPIGRKFGAPVIAIANPADVFAIDALRATIERGFIQVVAPIEQIEACTQRVYGPDASAPVAPAAPDIPGVLVDSVGPAPVNGNPTPSATPHPFAGTGLASPLNASSNGSSNGATNGVGHGAGVAMNGFPPAPAAPPAYPGIAAVPATPLGGRPPLAPPAPGSSVASAADLVDAAVSEYESAPGHDHPAPPPGVPVGQGSLSFFPPLARVLVEGGRVPFHEMQSVLDEHATTGQSIARVLTARRLVTESDLMWGMAQEMHLEFVDLEVRHVDFSASFIIPEATARHHNVLVIGHDEGRPVVAASNPTDVFAMDDLRTIIGRNFVTVVATRSQINTFIDRAYHSTGEVSAVATEAAIDLPEQFDDLTNIQTAVDDAPIVRYVNLLILQALNERASDIHVEPTAHNLRIRFRIDGVLHDMSEAPRGIAPAVTTRLKVMADMNIAEHRIPQDGRISLTVGNRPIDLRMATLPTIHGEKVVMRVLDKSSVVLGFEDLGFDADLMERYREVYTKPYGTILVTGPTGSGKTTTLYATLSAINSPEKNIITVEDPVELQLKGINQVQLNLKAGLTFASALRSILRADPDVLLVGEIRDRETAVISIEAALTGHLVLATLHTNDAASTPMRLVEMGMEPFLVTSAVSGVIAQRLCRRLCVHCREPYEATEADISSSGWRPEEVFTGDKNPQFYKAIGCSACSNTGYRGRMALLELLVMNEEVERLVVEGGSADDLHRLAVSQGMVTLRQSGLRKAVEGGTTLEEVLRVVA